MPTTTKPKPKRSIKLSQSQIDDLIKRQSAYPTKIAAGIGIGINSDTLDRAIRIGSCNEISYKILFPNDPLPDDDDVV